jgi:hypothetical protein
LHEISNDNGVWLVNFATSRNIRVKSTMFPHCNIHKYTWMSPDGKTHNQIDHILVDRLDVRSFRASDCEVITDLIRALWRVNLMLALNHSLLNIIYSLLDRYRLQRKLSLQLRFMGGMTGLVKNFFLNPILFATCSSTFSKLCVTYTVTCRRELSSAPL